MGYFASKNSRGNKFLLTQQESQFCANQILIEMKIDKKSQSSSGEIKIAFNSSLFKNISVDVSKYGISDRCLRFNLPVV
jgi:hypothetical protein